MKSKIMIIAISILFLFTSLSFAGQRNKGNKKQGNRQEKRYDNRGGKKYNNRDRRYDARDHHKNQRLHRGHRHHIPDYHGHRKWKRWSEWDRHYRHNRDRYRGGYYHNDDRGNLVFTHCQDDRDSSTCISFGIYF